jgi:hypothetical protein
MAERKYDKYFNEVNSLTFLHLSGVEGYVPYEVNHYDYRDNEETPHFMEAGTHGGPIQKAPQVPPVGAKLELIDPRIYYSTLYRSTPMPGFPCSRPFSETRHFMSLDPDHPDDIGATFHMWMGSGEDAELHVVDKPTTQFIPAAVVTMPQYTAEQRTGLGMAVVLVDNPLEAITQPGAELFPTGFEFSPTEGWLPPKTKPLPKGTGKYGKYFSEINVKDLPIYPSHKGKVARIMYYDGGYNAEAPHCVDCYLIYGSGIGFGLGNEKKLPVLPNGETDQTSSYEPLLPHKHPFYQTFSFNPTDKSHFPDLGGTVEFWIGEGDKAEKHVITKATNVLIPRHTTHLPLYVREVHRPFTILTILDSSLWAGIWSLEFPAGFKL